MRVRLVVALLALVAACSTTRVVRVPLEAALDERSDPPTALVNHVRLAVLRKALDNDPERRVGLTNDEAESYPTQTHQAVSIPQALREVGFDVVEVLRKEDASAFGVDYLLELGDPEVQAFHPAQGSRVTLVGSAYDVHVRYSGAIKDRALAPVGAVEGHGRDTSRHRFMEPLAKATFVGAFVSAATFSAALGSLVVMLRLGVLANVAGRGDLFGVCGPESTFRGPQGRRPLDLVTHYPPPGVTRQGICVDIVNNSLYGAFVAAVSVLTGVAGGLAGALAENIFDVFMAGMHISVVDPSWRRMVKHAHDSAARDLADNLALRILHDRHAAPRPGGAAGLPMPGQLVTPPADPAPAPAPR